jgi:hypothetical protein
LIVIPSGVEDFADGRDVIGAAEGLRDARCSGTQHAVLNNDMAITER